MAMNLPPRIQLDNHDDDNGKNLPEKRQALKKGNKKVEKDFFSRTKKREIQQKISDKNKIILFHC